MSFRAPVLLWALGMVPLLLWWLSGRERLRRTLADRFVGEGLRGRDRWRQARPTALTLAAALAILAAAGPRFGSQTTRTRQRETNTIIALDTSLSMAAEDVGTSRLAAGRAIARRLIEASSGRVGLVAFEGNAEVIAPLTTDHEAVETLLDSLEPGDLGQPGSDLAAAVRQSVALAATAGRQNVSVILISDGEEQGASAADAIVQARRAGLPVTTVLIGTQAGSKIPLAPGEFLKDESGAEVTSRASTEPMATVAAKTGGKFISNPFSAAAIDALTGELASRSGITQLTVKVPIERFQWPLGGAVAALLLAFYVDRGGS